MNSGIIIGSNVVKTNQNFDDQDWFVVRTNSRCEKKVFDQLMQLGYTCFLPLQTTIRMWSDRKKKVTLPLIPSVVFVQGMNCDRSALYKIEGIYSILKSNGKIGRVRNNEIEQLKIIIDENLEIFPDCNHTFFKGDNVEVINGPLKGLFAYAIQETNSYRVIIEITDLGLGYCVSLPKNCIRKI